MSLESLTRLVNQGNAVEPICLEFKKKTNTEVGRIKYVHILNPRICEYVNLHSKREVKLRKCDGEIKVKYPGGSNVINLMKGR